jgi:hypothetical protein
MSGIDCQRVLATGAALLSVPAGAGTGAATAVLYAHKIIDKPLILWYTLYTIV